jgi:pentatricopeptide repeat protein
VDSKQLAFVIGRHVTEVIPLSDEVAKLAEYAVGNVFDSTTLISWLTKAGRQKEALMVYRDLLDRRKASGNSDATLEPDLRFFSAALGACRGNTATAKQVWEEMCRSSVTNVATGQVELLRPDAVAYSLLIRCCGRNVDEAFALYQRMLDEVCTQNSCCCWTLTVKERSLKGPCTQYADILGFARSVCRCR